MTYPQTTNDSTHGGNPIHSGEISSWVRRRPLVTATVIAVAIWFAVWFALSDYPGMRVPNDWRPVVGWVAYFAGVVIGSRSTGLTGTRGWVVVPVITLAVGLVVAGVLGYLGLQLP